MAIIGCNPAKCSYSDFLAIFLLNPYLFNKPGYKKKTTYNFNFLSGPVQYKNLLALFGTFLNIHGQDTATFFFDGITLLIVMLRLCFR